MSLGETLADKALDYAVENPQQVMDLGKTAVGFLANTAEKESPFRPYLIGAGVGLVLGLALAIWLQPRPPSKREER